jgi:hypothetical protein
MHLQHELSLQDSFSADKEIHITLKAAEEIGRGVCMSEKEMQIVRLAAWLYDNNFTSWDESEKASIKDSLLPIHHVSSEIIKQAYTCVQASKPPCNPSNLMEETLCDASSCYLAGSSYFEQEKLLRKDLKKDKQPSKEEWLLGQIDLFTNHRFFTSYAIEKFTKGKEKNLLLLKQKLGKATEGSKIWGDSVKKKDKSPAKPANGAEAKVGRGIETMLRTTMASHLELSVMADNKANIMISINAIIISFLISSFVHKFNDSPDLILPTILLTLVCLLTIIFSLLSTRPTIKMKRS